MFVRSFVSHTHVKEEQNSGQRVQQGPLLGARLTLGLQAVEDHRLAAAAHQGPGRADEHPGEGLRGGGVQRLRQAEEVGGPAAAHVRLTLVTLQRWTQNNRTAAVEPK